MHDSVSSWTMADQQDPVSADEAIELIESGEANDGIIVDLGDGVMARADGRQGLQGLLQRLRGHRLIMSLSKADASDEIVSMRDGEPDMHPDVAVILDALEK